MHFKDCGATVIWLNYNELQKKSYTVHNYKYMHQHKICFINATESFSRDLGRIEMLIKVVSV